MAKGTCEGCGEPDRYVGPFRDGGRTWQALCGSCKVQRTMTPERTARLERDLSAMGCTVEIDVGDEPAAGALGAALLLDRKGAV